MPDAYLNPGVSSLQLGTRDSKSLIRATLGGCNGSVQGFLLSLVSGAVTCDVIRLLDYFFVISL